MTASNSSSSCCRWNLFQEPFRLFLPLYISHTVTDLSMECISSVKGKWRPVTHVFLWVELQDFGVSYLKETSLAAHVKGNIGWISCIWQSVMNSIPRSRGHVLALLSIACYVFTRSGPEEVIVLSPVTCSHLLAKLVDLNMNHIPWAADPNEKMHSDKYINIIFQKQKENIARSCILIIIFKAWAEVDVHRKS